MGNLPNPMAKKNAEGRVEICPQRPSACDEFQLVIPWRVALQQSPPLLHQPLGSMRYSSLARLEFFSERHSVSYSLVSPEGSTSGCHPPDDLQARIGRDLRARRKGCQS